MQKRKAAKAESFLFVELPISYFEISMQGNAFLFEMYYIFAYKFISQRQHIFP
jgi:hypothetical protein